MATQESRALDNFHLDLKKEIMKDLWRNERVMDDKYLGRMVDADALAKCRLRRYGYESKNLSKYTQRSGDYDDMQKAKDKFRAADKTVQARDWDLDQNVAAIYFNAFGTGFYGEPYPSKNTEWTCPRCGLCYQLSLKTLPERCMRCGRETPIGELYKEKVLKR